ARKTAMRWEGMHGELSGGIPVCADHRGERLCSHARTRHLLLSIGEGRAGIKGLCGTNRIMTKECRDASCAGDSRRVRAFSAHFDGRRLRQMLIRCVNVATSGPRQNPIASLACLSALL